MPAQEIVRKLKRLSNPKNVEGMKRFGINPHNTLGIPIPVLRKIAKDIGRDHAIALDLWSSGLHEGRILASMIDDPDAVTEKQMESWVKHFDSWDDCDQVCMNLFSKTKSAYTKAAEWSASDEEFVKRAGFALMACLAWTDKKADDKQLERFLPLIKKASSDERNFVKKAVNWALRQIGKRNIRLNKKAIATARIIQKTDSKSARWIANDALRELEGAAVQRRLTK
ncbi:MAG: DNA alkylation repair protein [Candidatus ainarchaeum sp.]|nr:DNA alkylation repair protein [Candidatus ainarchaeum sp.]